MRVRANIKHGEIVFTSPQAKRAFFERNDGKDAIIDIDDAPTVNSRRYFEGALIPAIYYQHPKSGWIDFKDAREAIKLEFLPGYTRSLQGERTRVARSTTELSKAGFLALIEAITRWMHENGLEVPDGDDYKLWRDSAPATHEVYPPLARMQATYNSVLLKDKPWRKKPKIV